MVSDVGEVHSAMVPAPSVAAAPMPPAVVRSVLSFGLFASVLSTAEAFWVFAT